MNQTVGEVFTDALVNKALTINAEAEKICRFIRENRNHSITANLEARLVGT